MNVGELIGVAEAEGVAGFVQARQVDDGVAEKTIGEAACGC